MWLVSRSSARPFAPAPGTILFCSMQRLILNRRRRSTTTPIRSGGLPPVRDGQNVQSYAIEYWTGREWKQIVKAQAIGHEKVDIFAPVTASRVRLNILSSTGAAAIREFQLFHLEPTQEEAKALSSEAM